MLSFQTSANLYHDTDIADEKSVIKLRFYFNQFRLTNRRDNTIIYLHSKVLLTRKICTVRLF
jgi:hypothetical protein